MRALTAPSPATRPIARAFPARRPRASAFARHRERFRATNDYDRRNIFAAVRRDDDARAPEVASVEPEIDYLGYDEPWQRELVMFWREYARARDRSVRALVDAAETRADMRDPVAISRAGDRLRRLLPDIDVCAVFERDPGVLRLEFISASKRVLELQDVLCSSDMCRDVTGLIERHPTLLLVDDIEAHIERAVEKLAALEPRCDARAVVQEFPELIYRIHSYDYVESLPISIQNMLLDSASEDEARLEDYERAWNEREAADRDEDPFADSALEWTIDGYFEGPVAD